METLLIMIAVAILLTGLSKAAGNPLNHTTRFRARRLLNWLPLGLTYAFLYMGRYNLKVSKFGASCAGAAFASAPAAVCSELSDSGSDRDGGTRPGIRLGTSRLPPRRSLTPSNGSEIATHWPS